MVLVLVVHLHTRFESQFHIACGSSGNNLQTGLEVICILDVVHFGVIYTLDMVLIQFNNRLKVLANWLWYSPIVIVSFGCYFREFVLIGLNTSPTVRVISRG